jgi:rSAM/selenodomain-associated transferase 2
MKPSVIIPALNEAEILGATLESVMVDPSAEVIVVDGGSRDRTVEVARQYTSQVLVSPSGRGLQQAVGARHSEGSVLIFLHADTRLPPGYQHFICEALAYPNVVFGAFYLAIHPSNPALELIAFMANLRSRCLRLPYGDQVIFVRREAYFQVGGFKNWPIMEDVDLARRPGGGRGKTGSIPRSEIGALSYAMAWASLQTPCTGIIQTPDRKRPLQSP